MCNCRIFINVTIKTLDIIHFHVFYLKHDVSETGFGLRLRVEVTQVLPKIEPVSVSELGVGSTSTWRQNPVSETSYFNKRQNSGGDDQNCDSYMNIPSSQTHRYYIPVTCDTNEYLVTNSVNRNGMNHWMNEWLNAELYSHSGCYKACYRLLSNSVQSVQNQQTFWRNVYVPPKRRRTFNRLQGVISQNIVNGILYVQLIVIIKQMWAVSGTLSKIVQISGAAPRRPILIEPEVNSTCPYYPVQLIRITGCILHKIYEKVHL
jgi:hypothetical protein